MTSVLLFDRDENEQEMIHERLAHSVAMLSDDRLECSKYSSIEQADAHVSGGSPLDLSMIEISKEDDIAFTRRVRESREHADMMIMADSGISPMKYMTPDIRACSLLLRPFDKGEMSEVVHDFLSAYYRKRETPSEDNSIVIENRDGRIVVPYSHIYYVEAREKKVFFRVKDREYSKYDTLENVKASLPSNFMQSHRSFMFNTSYLEKIKLSDNTVYLEQGITVPLARSFKASIKEYLSGLSGK